MNNYRKIGERYKRPEEHRITVEGGKKIAAWEVTSVGTARSVQPTIVMYLVGSAVKMRPEELFSMAFWILLCDYLYV